MSNPGMRLTCAGMNVLARGLLGEEIHFTKAALGDGDFDYDTEKVIDLTELKSWKMDLPLAEKVWKGDGTAEIVAQLQNYSLEKGFRAKEHGIFAIDQLTGDEVLYAYRNAGDEYSFIPAKLGVVHGSLRYAYTIEIGDAENVTADIDFSFAYVGRDRYDTDIAAIISRLKFLWENYLIPTGTQINEILAGDYIPSNSNGDAEFNGVPTTADIINIIAETYAPHYTEIDDYGINADEVPDENTIDAIINGTY